MLADIHKIIVLPLLLSLSLTIHSQEAIQDSIYIIVERMPEYPGLEKAYMRFLQENLQIPAKVIPLHLVFSFIVEKDGSISNLTIERSRYWEIDYTDEKANEIVYEALTKMIDKMPLWRPGKNGGVPVRVKYTTPIHYELRY